MSSAATLDSFAGLACPASTAARRSARVTCKYRSLIRVDAWRSSPDTATRFAHRVAAEWRRCVSLCWHGDRGLLPASRPCYGHALVSSTVKGLALVAGIPTGIPGQNGKM